MPNSNAWTFTVQINDNYDEISLHLFLLSEADNVAYIIAGRELAPTTGQVHLQSYIRFNDRLSFRTVRGLLPQCHLERSRGNAKQNIDYCRKDGDYVEFGECPPIDGCPGRRSDWDEYHRWCSEQSSEPTDRDIIDKFPSLFGRYRGACRVIARELAPRPILRDGNPRLWQQQLFERLQQPADDRTIEFYVDDAGGHGKSWFCGYAYSRIRDVQLLGPGRRDDLAHMIDVRTKVFLINIPRGQMEFIQYGLLEMLKDRMVTSPKYESTMKILHSTPHVIVFCNEQPDMTKMSNDRYVIVNL